MDLGDVTKADTLDHTIGDAAFALPGPGVTDVIKGHSGYLIVRVLAVTP